MVLDKKNGLNWRQVVAGGGLTIQLNKSVIEEKLVESPLSCAEIFLDIWS